MQLSDTLKEIPQLVELDLTHSNFTDSGLVYFANEYLGSSPKHLKVLNLSYNKLATPEAAFHFGQGLLAAVGVGSWLRPLWHRGTSDVGRGSDGEGPGAGRPFEMHARDACLNRRLGPGHLVCAFQSCRVYKTVHIGVIQETDAGMLVVCM